MTRQLIAGAIAFGFSAGLIACGGGTPSASETAASASGQAGATGGASVRADLIKDWESQKETMATIADAMPEDEFGYKSTPAQRSYGEQVMHIATVNADFLKVIGGKATPPAFTAESAKTKGEMLDALRQSYDYAIALLNEQTDASINETIDADFLGPSTRARVFWFLLGHSMDTYGQMVVYLRLNGIVPPASRGV